MVAALAWLASSVALNVAPCHSRRNAMCFIGASAFGAVLPALPVVASESSTAVVTDKVRLEFVQQISAEESVTLPVTIGLFGRDAPSAVSSFKAACTSALVAPCPTEVDLSSEVMERSKQSKKAALRVCQGSESLPVSYAYSTVWSIQRGKRIDAGQVQGKFALRLAPVTPLSESTGLSHDQAGLLSVRRGGGSFDFSITTAPVPEFDTDYVVIGRVLDGMDSVQALDAMPVVKAADGLAVEGPRSSRASACEYSNPQPFCAQNKPLKKVLLMRTALL